MAIVISPFTGQLDITGNGGGASAATRYVLTFNSTTDWGSPSGGFYTISILGATHGRGINPQIQTYELIVGNYQAVQVDQISVNNVNGNTTFRVPSSPDLRFAGIIIFI